MSLYTVHIQFSDIVREEVQLDLTLCYASHSRPQANSVEWDYSGRKGWTKKKKIGKANERKGKVKRTKDEEVNG